MPGALAHVFFALDCLEEDRGNLDFLIDNLDLVLAGSEGPDPFYFHSMVPWRVREGAEKVHGLADWLHASQPGAFLPRWFALVDAEEDAQEKKMLGAYLYGLVLHYLLDRRVHPYVYSRSGFDAQGGLTGIHAAHHARFETSMDVSLAAKRQDTLSRKAARTRFHLGDKEIRVFADLHAGAFPDRITREECRAAWADFATIQAFMCDPGGRKRFLLSAVLGPDSRAAALARPRRLPGKDQNDYCNEACSAWPDPVTGLARFESLADLWKLAMGERHEVVRLLARIVAAPKAAIDPTQSVAPGLATDYPELAGLEPLNHEGLLPGQKMRYCQPVFKNDE